MLLSLYFDVEVTWRRIILLEVNEGDKDGDVDKGGNVTVLKKVLSIE